MSQCTCNSDQPNVYLSQNWFRTEFVGFSIFLSFSFAVQEAVPLSAPSLTLPSPPSGGPPSVPNPQDIQPPPVPSPKDTLPPVAQTPQTPSGPDLVPELMQKPKTGIQKIRRYTQQVQLFSELVQQQNLIPLQVCKHRQVALTAESMLTVGRRMARTGAVT